MALNLSNFNFVTNTPCKNVPFVGELLYVLNSIVMISSVRACVCVCVKMCRGISHICPVGQVNR